MKLLRDTWLMFQRYVEILLRNPAWVVIGVAVLFYLRSNRPQSLQEARQVFGEAPALATQGAPVS